MNTAKRQGEKVAVNTSKVSFNYTQEGSLLPLSRSYIETFNELLAKKEGAFFTHLEELIPIYLGYFKERFAKTLAEGTLIPVENKQTALVSILSKSDWQVLWVSPQERPNMLEYGASKEHKLFIHTKSENDWKLAPDQLDTWCKENGPLIKKTLVYLPRPLTGKGWKLGELKRLCEVAAKYGVYFFREEYGDTLSEESFLHFYPEKSFVFFNPFEGTLGMNWGLSCLILPQTNGLNEVWQEDSSTKLQTKITGLEKAALLAFSRSYKDMEAWHAQWETVLGSLRREVGELLSSTKLTFKKPESGNSFYLDFEAYRIHFGRKEVLNSAGLCARIFQDCQVKLVPGMDLGSPPGTLVAAMFLSHLNDLSWFQGSPEQQVEAGLIYKQFWNCIEGAQKLARYLNSLS